MYDITKLLIDIAVKSVGEPVSDYLVVKEGGIHWCFSLHTVRWHACALLSVPEFLLFESVLNVEFEK